MLSKNPIIILECANSHGGSKKVFLKLINKFAVLDYSNLHIKFQPFKYDEIATSNYNWYKVYKKLYFKKSFWNNAIRKSSKLYKGIWLDIFDSYGLDVLKENISKIYGIKIQSSVIQNEKIYNELKNFNNQKLSLIINISGYNLYEIKDLLIKYQKLKFKLIILQCGFQSYPTKVSNLNLNKINYLKKKFNLNNISFADHTDSRDDFSLYFPSFNEVETADIADYFQKNDISFSYPKIIKQDRYLDFIKNKKDQKFIANHLYTKLLEPFNGEKISPDILILPLLAFDPYLSRLGMGGGFFDRTIEFLKNQKNSIITIGLAYDFQRSRAPLAIENTDQKLDFVVTEKTIFPAS